MNSHFLSIISIIQLFVKRYISSDTQKPELKMIMVEKWCGKEAKRRISCRENSKKNLEYITVPFLIIFDECEEQVWRQFQKFYNALKKLGFDVLWNDVYCEGFAMC